MGGLSALAERLKTRADKPPMAPGSPQLSLLQRAARRPSSIALTQREPQVHATYYYLRAAPDDTAARRQDRHHLFAIEAQRIVQSLAAWLAMPEKPPPGEWLQTCPIRSISEATPTAIMFLCRLITAGSLTC